MRGLSQRQEAFALRVVAGDTLIVAYRKAGYKIADKKTAYEAASRLSKNSKIVARLAELPAPVVKAARVEMADHLKRLDTLGKKAEAKGQFAPAVNAEIHRGKACGLYVERSEVSGADGQPLIPAPQGMAGFYAELARIANAANKSSS